MTDTERLDWIIKDCQRRLGFGGWWAAMHEIHKGAIYPGRDPREIIDIMIPPSGG